VRWILALVLLASAAFGYVFWQRRAAEPKPLQFSSAKVTRGTLEETVTATGTLSPVDQVDLGAEVTGRLVKVNVDVNDEVEAGQVLAEIDPEQLRARVQESQAQLNSALANDQSVKASLAEAELKTSRLKALFDRGLASAEELETAEAALARAKASVATAKAQITVARAGLTSTQTSQAKATIVAPISGIVLVRAVEPGQTVTAGFQTPVLFTLARDLSQLELTVEVDEADIGKVQEGQVAKFVVDAYPERTFESKLIKLHSMPTTTTTTVVTYAAVLIVDNKERLLRPGMTATATITTRTLSNELLVPNAALRFQPPRPESARDFSPFFGMGRPSRTRSAATAEPPASKHRDRV
jgi:HlyD family secretion protein